MSVPLGEKSDAEKRPIPWYWVSAFFALALLGVLLDSAISPEDIRFLGNPLTSIGLWGAVLCVLFKRENAKSGHPHQTQVVFEMDTIFIIPPIALLACVTSPFFPGSATLNLVLGAIIFSVILLFRHENNSTAEGSLWPRKECRTCGTILIGSQDLSFIKDPEQRAVTHCHHCGTNCEGPITQPLTPTAQEFIDGDKADLGFGSLLVDSSQVPPDPLPFPYYEYSSLIGPSILVIFAITFRSVTSMPGPYPSLQWLLGFAGITWYVFASRSISQNVKSPCPHCQANLFTLAFRSGTLRRVIRYRKKDGHYVVVAAPRYCPYCGHDIETPPLIPPPEEPSEASDTPQNI
ncbi:MAG: hypothetical protein ACO1RA_10950 [Planctomycetaceae bacterium]